MAHRVLPAEVKEIIDTELSDPIVVTFIDAANLTVTALLGSDTTLGAAQLKEIERWYTAHLIACTRARQVKSESVGDASVTYQGETGKGLDASMYGQMVKQLDTSGIMAAAGSGKQSVMIQAITSFE